MADITVKYKNAVIAEMSAEGTKTLKTSGKYCEDDISIAYIPPAAEVVTQNFKIYEKTYSKASGWVTVATLDDEVMAHVNDDRFSVLLIISDAYAYEFYSGDTFFATNTAYGQQSSYPIYGVANKQQSETVHSYNPIYYKPSDTTTSESLGGGGRFRLNGKTLLLKPGDGFIRGGNYRLIFTW